MILIDYAKIQNIDIKDGNALQVSLLEANNVKFEYKQDSSFIKNVFTK